MVSNETILREKENTMKKFTNAELLELDLNKTEKNKNNKNYYEGEKNKIPGSKELIDSLTENIPDTDIKDGPDNDNVTNLVSGN